MNVMLRFLLLFSYFFNLAIADCVLSLKDDFKTAQPLVLKLSNSTYGRIIYPDEKSLFRVEREKIIIIACPGYTVNVNGESHPEILPVMCINGRYFQTSGYHTINLINISCNKSAVVQLKNSGIENDYTKIAVRYKFESLPLHLPPQIVHYFDDTLKITAFSMYSIVNTVKGQTNCWQSSYFSDAGYYKDLNVSMTDIFKKNQQQKTINSLLGLPTTSEKYINTNTGELYLARGHLAASCDFVYEAQQKATYNYVNVVPQWQSFNNGNWKRLETNLRNYATRNGHLFIVAGTLGVLKLPHSRTQTPTELYLAVNIRRKAVVPVPKFMFKLAFDIDRARGAVFIGMNNPYQRQVEYICPDKSKDMEWLTWDKNNPTKGFSYACTINDFRRVVRNLPFYKEATNGLLI